jgi:hypothetical protein
MINFVDGDDARSTCWPALVSEIAPRGVTIRSGACRGVVVSFSALKVAIGRSGGVDSGFRDAGGLSEGA